HPLEDADHFERLVVQRDVAAHAEVPRGRERGADHRDAAVILAKEPSTPQGQRGVVAIGRWHREIDPEDQLLRERHELRGRRVERQHDLPLHARDAGSLGDGADGRRRQDTAGGEPGAHAHAAAGHRDLAEHEPVAALDEANDSLAHRAEGHQAGDADGDAEDGEEIAAQDSQGFHHSSRDSTGRPARRRAQTFMRAAKKSTRNASRVLQSIFMNAPPKSTLSTASTTQFDLGCRNTSKKAGSYYLLMNWKNGRSPRSTALW